MTILQVSHTSIIVKNQLTVSVVYISIYMDRL